MPDNFQDKKDTVPDLPSAKSYSTDGNTAEFDPGALQVHAISRELRQQMSGTELPRLDPKYLHDTLLLNRNVGASTVAAPAAANTQPSLRRIRKLASEPTWRRRGLHGFLALLILAIAWEVAVLVRTPGSLQVSGARPRSAETTEPAAVLNPEQVPAPARTATLAASAAPPDQAERVLPPATPTPEPAPAAHNSSPEESLPRATELVQDFETVHQEANVSPKPRRAEAAQPISSSKSPSKVLFPPQ